uniref:Ras-GAP domain-containing protein n=3 Tax=Clytia hemisphaerica TaxID=252671 RepID=A0A7M5VE60_9CNID
MHVELKRFKNQLPINRPSKKSVDKSLSIVKSSLVGLAKHQFELVVTSLVHYIKDIPTINLLPIEQQPLAIQSNLIVVTTIEHCFEKHSEESSSLSDETVKRQLLNTLCSLIIHPDAFNEANQKVGRHVGNIIYFISKHHFSSVFSRIVERLYSLVENNEDSTIADNLELIRYLHVPIEGLKCLFEECGKHFKFLKKYSQQVVLKGLCKSIWNWIETYPEQFCNIYKNPNTQLSELSEKLFQLVENWSENSKKRSISWPLQGLLLLLSPECIQEASGSGEVTKGTTQTKRNFLENLRKSLSSGRSSSAEPALLACVHLCKASTFINREDNSVLFIVSQVLNELKTLLFTVDKPYTSTSGLHVNDLMVDLFVASFRLNHRNSQHFEVCFLPDCNPIFQTAIIKGYHKIVKEKSLEWWPKIEVVYARSTQIRSMFQNCIKRMTSYEGPKQPTPRQSAIHRSSTLSKVGSTRKKEDSSINYEKDTELLLWLMRLFHADPQLALINYDKNAAAKQASSMQLMNGLVIIMMFDNLQDVSTQVSETMLRLHAPQNIELWNPEAPMATFWEISSHIVFNVADRLLGESASNQLKAMRWLQKILKCRIEFLERNSHQALIGTHNSICSEALSKLEMIFLVTLWSSETEKVLLAMKCFGLLYEECSLLTTDRPIHPAPLTSAYYKFSNDVLQTGRTALHKKILSTLREVTTQTPGNIKAWEYTLNKWQKMTQGLINYPRDELLNFDLSAQPSSKLHPKEKNAFSPVSAVSNEALEKTISEWSKMTGFLCAMGGICATESVEKPKSPTVDNTFGFNTLQDTAVNRFISKLLSLLVCTNEHTSLNLRSAVKESLGFDLSTPLYPSFFAQCKATLGCLFDDNNQAMVNKENTIYVEQLIYVIRCILENKVDGVAAILITLPVEDIILEIVKYIRALSTTVQTLVVKSKMCNLVENIMIRRLDLSFRQEMKFRNELVNYLTDWVLYTQDENQNLSQEIQAISCNLDEAAMRSVAILLKGLPLQPDCVDQDITEAKSELFLKHFKLFMTILDKCYGIMEEKQRKGSLAPHFTKLRDSTVQAMSNMLSANIDSGLKHSIGLGYHEDTQTRATFLEVLTDILRQGTEFESLADTVLQDRFASLVKLLVTSNADEELPIVMALCNSVSTDVMDEVAQVLVNIFDNHGSLHVLLWNLFRDEVERTETQQTLFRGNSIASKAMTYSFKIYGSGYLHLLLGPIIKDMGKSLGKSYEVDEARLEKGENKADNTQNVIELANRFMDIVHETRPSFPMQLQSLCHCLHKAVQQKFPSHSYGAVSSAFFLRFINPVIMSPHSHGIVNQQVAASVRRGLTLLSKILQNLANHLHFTKEAHMEVFNGFLENNFHRIHAFFREISTEPRREPQYEETDIDAVDEDEDEDEEIFTTDGDILSLHKLLWHAQEKIGKYLSVQSDSVTFGRGPYEKLVTLLAHLGPPENQPNQFKSMVGIPRDRLGSIGWRLEDFMAKYAGRNQEELEQIKNMQLFYVDGKSKAGRPVFYYIARKYINDQVSDEMLLYHMLLTLQSKRNQIWELVVDFTHSSEQNWFKIETLARAFVILPESQVTSPQTIYFYNVNSSVKQYAIRCDRIMRPLKNHPRVIIIDKLPKLYEHIHQDELRLPSSTISLEKDNKVYSASKPSVKGSFLVKIGPQSIQLQACERVKVLTFSCLLNDVFYASEIEKASHQDDVLDLEFTSRRTGLKFVTPQAEEIVNSILHVQARWRLSQQDKTKHMASKKMRPKDVPGTLLNMSLINLGNRDPSLRLAAYNLLCALTTNFSLQINERLWEAKGVCIPANCTLFIKSISEQLALREPNMTLEFLDECISCFAKSNDESRNLCLNYMAPWFPNLARYCGLSRNDPNKLQMMEIVKKLIDLTISNRQNYPFIQASVWANIGKIPDLLDVVLDLFMKTSTAGGFNSEKAEVLADTSVTLASANVAHVSKKILDKFHTVIDRTRISHVESLERHLMWDDIAILARYLLMLSFNDSLDVLQHLPDIFHIVTLLVSSGPVSLRASIHGLVINSLQSLLTCEMKLSDKTQLLIRKKLEDLSLQKFYLLFGISNVKSTPVKAFVTQTKVNRTFYSKLKSREADTEISLSSLEVIAETLLSIVEACCKDLKNENWIDRWTALCSSHCYDYNPAIQPRCNVVLGVISKESKEDDINRALDVLTKATGVYQDFNLAEATLMCLAKYQALLKKDSSFHKILFWVAVSVLQFGEQSLYPAALCLLEQNLYVSQENNLYTVNTLQSSLLEYRNDIAYHWIFKQLDHICGLSFSSSFDFALAALLLKGLRHPSAKTKSSAIRILHYLLTICSKAQGTKEKFEVNKHTVPYLAVLMSVSDEVLSKLNNERPVYTPSNFKTLKRLKSKKTIDVSRRDSAPSVVITTSSQVDSDSAQKQQKRQIDFDTGTYNCLLNPRILDTENYQVLLVVILSTMLDHSMDDFEGRIILEVLAEASSLYTDIFPVTFSILHRKLCNVLTHSEDQETLTAAQKIVQSTSHNNMDKPYLKLQHLTSLGFHGLHSFTGPFVERSDPQTAPQMFARFLSTVLDQSAPVALSSEGRSSSGQIFKAPSSVDDVAICTSSSSNSLNAISATTDTGASSGSGLFSAFKRVGSYSPARRQKKIDGSLSARSKDGKH